MAWMAWMAWKPPCDHNFCVKLVYRSYIYVCVSLYIDMSLYIDIYRWMDGWMDGGFKQHPPGWLMSPASGSFIIAGKAGNTEMGAEISRRIHMKREKFMRNHEKSLNSIIYIYIHIYICWFQFASCFPDRDLT